MTMSLKQWRHARKLTLAAAGTLFSVTGSTVFKYENSKAIPAPVVMRRIYVETAGAVDPNSFYDLPPLRRNIGAPAAAVTVNGHG